MVTCLPCVPSAGGWRAAALLRRVSLELPALFCTHALKDGVPGDPTQQFLEQPEVCSPKAQGPNSKHRVLP